MRTGDIIFVRGTSLISRLVLLFDKGKFSHVAIAVSDHEVIETNWKMKSKIVEFHYKDYEIVRLDLTDSQRNRVPVMAKTLEGKWYDYLQVLGYISKSRLNNPRYLICSELVSKVLSGIGYYAAPRQDLTPNELYTVLKQRVAE